MYILVAYPRELWHNYMIGKQTRQPPFLDGDPAMTDDTLNPALEVREMIQNHLMQTAVDLLQAAPDEHTAQIMLAGFVSGLTRALGVIAAPYDSAKQDSIIALLKETFAREHACYLTHRDAERAIAKAAQ